LVGQRFFGSKGVDTAPMLCDEESRSRGNSDISEEGDRRLEHTWTWYYVEKSAHGKMTEEEYNKMLQPLGTFSTIKAFWEYWSNIMETKNFPDASTLYLFKEGIRPMWEDPQNIHGGKLQSVLPKSVSHQVWSDLVLSAIGEQLDSEDQVDFSSSLYTKSPKLQVRPSSSCFPHPPTLAASLLTSHVCTPQCAF
jgi:hypothetical protein